MDYYEKLFEHMVEHYARLAINPGWYHYAGKRVAQMMEESPELWAGLGDRVKKRKEELERESGIGLPAVGTVSEPQKR